MGIRHHTVRWIWVFIWQLSLIPSPANFPVCLDFPFLTEYFEREKEHDDAEVVTDLGAGREVYKDCPKFSLIKIDCCTKDIMYKDTLMFDVFLKQLKIF